MRPIGGDRDGLRDPGRDEDSVARGQYARFAQLSKLRVVRVVPDISDGAKSVSGRDSRYVIAWLDVVEDPHGQSSAVMRDLGDVANRVMKGSAAVDFAQLVR